MSIPILYIHRFLIMNHEDVRPSADEKVNVEVPDDTAEKNQT